jgi:hypothetical protein
MRISMRRLEEADLVGTTIDDIVRSEFECEEGAFAGAMAFCDFYLLLNTGITVKFGYHREFDPLATCEILPGSLIQCTSKGRDCRGQPILRVLVGKIGRMIYLELGSGDYLWHNADVESELLCFPMSYFEGDPPQLDPYYPLE